MKAVTAIGVTTCRREIRRKIRGKIRELSSAALIALACAYAQPAMAQVTASDIVLRLDQIEGQMRALTGQIEQLQFRNQQLQQQLQKAQEDNEFRFQQMGAGGGGAARGAAPAQAAPSRAQPQSNPQSNPQSLPQQMPAQPQQMPQQNDIHNGPNPVRPLPGRRGDVFDPNMNPGAPGAPRQLGALPAGQPSAPEYDIAAEEPSGVSGTREAGAPLDLGTMSGARGGSADAPSYAAMQPPAQTPKDQFDLGYGHIQRKEYALAEQALREFARRYPSDRLAPDASYWLGESFYQRQRYQDAAEAFLNVTTKYDTAAKAPDSLLRLGQSLAAMGQKEMACASFGEVERKYPRASVSVKQSVERELKRVRC